MADSIGTNLVACSEYEMSHLEFQDADGSDGAAAPGMPPRTLLGAPPPRSPAPPLIYHVARSP